MGRFLLTLVVGTILVIGSALYFGWTVPSDPATGPQEKKRQPLGKELFKLADAKPIAEPALRKGEKVVISDCYSNALDRVEISSPRAGQLLFVGYEVPMPRWFAGLFADYYRVHLNLGIATFFQGEHEIHIAYRRLHDGDKVPHGRMLAMVNPDLAYSDVLAKNAKLLASHADRDASDALWNEARDRLRRLLRLDPKVIPAEELSGAYLTEQKYRLEYVAKKYGVTMAGTELMQAETVLKQHYILNKQPGTSTIKMIYKSAGEGIKDQEPILQLQNVSKMRIEGKIDSPYLNRLKEGSKVVIEPIEEIPPIKLMQVHRTEITGIAVCNENLTSEHGSKKEPRFVTASENAKAVVWSSKNPAHPYVVGDLQHKSAVRAVACSPEGAKQNLCLTGCADGSVWLWELDKKDADPKPLADTMKQAITTLAFSPDGKYFATADQSNTICLWSTDDRKMLFPFDYEHHVDDAHQDLITSLHFTPQGQLISASRDMTLRIWQLFANGAKPACEPITNRAGHIGQLGVSKDGSKMLFDNGRTLQILSVSDQRPVWEIHNHGAANFEPIALFSPDPNASLILTGSGTEGRLQLWRSPTAKERGFEICQLVPRERTSVTCAAFSPLAGSKEGAFAVTGTKEGLVYFWKLPAQREIDEVRISKDESGQDLTLSHLERALEGNQVRVSVLVSNPHGRLIPGQRVTLVVQTE